MGGSSFRVIFMRGGTLAFNRVATGTGLSCSAILTGPIGTKRGWPSAARGTLPLLATGINADTPASVSEQNGFTLIDLTQDEAKIQLFAWRNEPSNIDTLSLTTPTPSKDDARHLLRLSETAFLAGLCTCTRSQFFAWSTNSRFFNPASRRCIREKGQHRNNRGSRIRGKIIRRLGKRCVKRRESQARMRTASQSLAFASSLQNRSRNSPRADTIQRI
ncbi:MAG: hypothetical protein CM1200mP9_11070 [Gammaproteobacteria bacterium]|nr:MAG: hypothetical protein CM1200mP9_11070 [Gammaproteobacteria bacterium]